MIDPEHIATAWLPAEIARWLQGQADVAVSEALNDEEPHLPSAESVIEDLLEAHPAQLTWDEQAEVRERIAESVIKDLDAEIHDIAIGAGEDRNSYAYNGVSQRDFL